MKIVQIHTIFTIKANKLYQITLGLKKATITPSSDFMRHNGFKGGVNEWLNMHVWLPPCNIPLQNKPINSDEWAQGLSYIHTSSVNLSQCVSDLLMQSTEHYTHVMQTLNKWLACRTMQMLITEVLKCYPGPQNQSEVSFFSKSEIYT